jgi:hypothetical protein
MTVILMTGEAGSCGADIAAGAADSLGLELVTIEQLERLVASRMCTGQDQLHRMINGRASMIERWNSDAFRLAACTTEELIQLAARDQILIQSWRVANLLRAAHHVICVHICASAPPGAPGAGMQKSRGLISAPYRCLRILGFASARFGDWGRISNPSGEREAYDLVLNTMAMSVGEGVERLICLARSTPYQTTVVSQSIVADLLQRTQTWRDGERALPAEGSRALDVDVGGERIGLNGIASNEEAIARIEQRLRRKASPFDDPAGSNIEPMLADISPWPVCRRLPPGLSHRL